jgi:hypothetical protein
LLALRDYKLRFPNGKKTPDADKRIGELKKELDGAIIDARSFADKPKRACEFWKKALKIAPDDPILMKEVSKCER